MSSWIYLITDLFQITVFVGGWQFCAKVGYGEKTAPFQGAIGGWNISFREKCLNENCCILWDLQNELSMFKIGQQIKKLVFFGHSRFSENDKRGAPGGGILILEKNV